MQSTLEPLEGNKVKLSVEVGSAEFDKAVDAAARKLAREVRMPGFRPGKVPRRVLEARMGHGALRQEALREALPEFYASAVREHEVDVIAAPDIDITAGEEEGDVRFDAVVEVRPSVQIPGYGGLQVTVDRPAATDEEIDRQVDRLRANAATLEDVSRPARDGDVLTINLGMTPAEGGVSGEPTELTDVSYTVGSEEFGVAELDTQLQGARAGDIIKFTTEVSPERSMSFQVLVKAVRAQVLPDLTDEWAAEETEFDTVAELREDTRTRITAVKRMQAVLQLREKALGRRRGRAPPPRPGSSPRSPGRHHRPVPAGHRAGAGGLRRGPAPGRRPVGEGRPRPASPGRRRSDRGHRGGARRRDRQAGLIGRVHAGPGQAQPRQ
jgi:trigger factor